MRSEPPRANSKLVQAVRKVLLMRETGLCVAILGVVGLIVALDRQGNFISPFNRTLLLHQFALLGVFSIGEAVVIIAGGIDLSPGSVIGFTGILCALLLQKLGQHVPAGDPMPIGLVAEAISLTLLAGLAIGLLHAFLITKLDLPPFVATLGTLAGLRSAANIITRSDPIPITDERFAMLGNTWWITLLIFTVIALVVAFFLKRTALGRQLYAMGGNESATRLSGVNVTGLKTIAYCISALLATVSGILYAGYVGQGHPNTGVGYELNAVASAVVGGCSLLGGLGSAIGTALGAALLVIVVNGTALVIKRDSTLWEGIIVGVVVILAVAVNKVKFTRS